MVLRASAGDLREETGDLGYGACRTRRAIATAASALVAPARGHIRPSGPGSDAFQALVPETWPPITGDVRGYVGGEVPHVQDFFESGARGTRTPDLLGAIQALSQTEL